MGGCCSKWNDSGESGFPTCRNSAEPFLVLAVAEVVHVISVNYLGKTARTVENGAVLMLFYLSKSI